VPMHSNRPCIQGIKAHKAVILKDIIQLVDGGHRGIVFSRLGGIQDHIYTEGLHFRVPWFQYPIIYDIR